MNVLANEGTLVLGLEEEPRVRWISGKFVSIRLPKVSRVIEQSNRRLGRVMESAEIRREEPSLHR